MPPSGAPRQGRSPADALSAAVLGVVEAAGAAAGAGAGPAAMAAAEARVREELLRRPADEDMQLSAAALGALELGLTTPTWAAIWASATTIHQVSSFSARFASQVAAPRAAARTGARARARGRGRAAGRRRVPLRAVAGSPPGRRIPVP
jgi:hypothetical protein